MAKDDTKAPGDVIVNESHYHSKKDRVFVRAQIGRAHV